MTAKPPERPSAAPAPSPSSWPPPPSETAPPFAWAVYYRELGAWPLPVRDAEDLRGYREYLVAREIAAGRSEEEAEANAAKRAAAGSKSTFHKWRTMRGPPTSRQIEQWWRDRPERGIVLLTGPGRAFCAIDVDTAKGGDGSPWEGTTPLVAETPSGGVHYVYQAAEIRSTVAELAPAVDTRGVGGLIAAPAGSASPGRRWKSWGEPTPFPAAEAARLASSAPRAVATSATSEGPEEEGDELAGLVVRPSAEDRSFAAALRDQAHDGERHRKAAAIVGLLARRRPLPEDARIAALKLLRDQAIAEGLPAAYLLRLERAWGEALLSSERSGEFCLEVMEAWNSTRGHPPWPAWKLEETATGLWRTATGREEAVAVAAAADEVDDELDQLLPSLADIYTVADFDADCQRGLLSLANLPHWAGWNGEIDPSVVTGHGWGEILDNALGGGVAPGYFLALGATQAKGGKTASLEQLVFGFALHSVAVRAGLSSGPIPVVYPVTEMWQGGEAGKRPPPGRQIFRRYLSRWLGVDSSLFRRGAADAGRAPGVRRLAEQLGEDPHELGIRILSTARRIMTSGPFRAALEFIRPLNVRWLASSHDKAEGEEERIDYRRGVPLLRALTQAILLDRERRAKAWKVPAEDIWPVIFIDPIQRFQGGGDNAVGTLDEFVEELRALADEHGFIILVTSDTNQAAARGQIPKGATPAQRAAGAFRGSYKLLHLPDAALVLEMKWPDPPKPGAPAHAEITVALNRWGPPMFEPAHYSFVPESGRYIPLAGPPVAADDLDIDEEEDDPPIVQVRGPGGKFGPKVGG